MKVYRDSSLLCFLTKLSTRSLSLFFIAAAHLKSFVKLLSFVAWNAQLTILCNMNLQKRYEDISVLGQRPAEEWEQRSSGSPGYRFPWISFHLSNGFIIPFWHNNNQCKILTFSECRYSFIYLTMLLEVSWCMVRTCYPARDRHVWLPSSIENLKCYEWEMFCWHQWF
jgi:hypothetical protein